MSHAFQRGFRNWCAAIEAPDGHAFECCAITIGAADLPVRRYQAADQGLRRKAKAEAEEIRHVRLPPIRRALPGRSHAASIVAAPF